MAHPLQGVRLYGSSPRKASLHINTNSQVLASRRTVDDGLGYRRLLEENNRAAVVDLQDSAPNVLIDFLQN